MDEIWKDIIGYEGKYQVSNYGEVRNIKTGKIRKLQPNKKDGYLYVSLCRSKIDQWKAKVHRIVLLSFIGPHIDIEKKYVDHINGNKHDNRLSNLRWVTFTENIHAAWDLGIYKNIGEMHPQSKLTNTDVLNIKSMLSMGVKNKYLSEMYGVGESAICDIKKGRTWRSTK